MGGIWGSLPCGARAGGASGSPCRGAAGRHSPSREERRRASPLAPHPSSAARRGHGPEVTGAAPAPSLRPRTRALPPASRPASRRGGRGGAEAADWLGRAVGAGPRRARRAGSDAAKPVRVGARVLREGRGLASAQGAGLRAAQSLLRGEAARLVSAFFFVFPELGLGCLLMLLQYRLLVNLCPSAVLVFMHL